MGYSPWGHKGSDTTEQLTHIYHQAHGPGGKSQEVWRKTRNQVWGRKSSDMWILPAEEVKSQLTSSVQHGACPNPSCVRQMKERVDG